MVRNICFLQVKAFGDLVIANTVAERVRTEDQSYLTLAIGQHLLPLCDAITPKMRVVELETAETGVPSIFDVRRNGVPAALKSAWQVRQAIARAPVARDSLILFDRLGRRERFLIGDRSAIGMETQTANIYQGYDAMLAAAGFNLKPIVPIASNSRRRVGIFPGSRLAIKNLPADLVADLLRVIDRAGSASELFLLDGERPDLEASSLPYTIVPRQFTALRDAIASMDIVISADSLPAHLAESLQVPVFVLTPRPNEFWMPRSVWTQKRWCLFDDPHRLDRVQSLLT